MAKTKLNGEVDKSLADQEIRKCDATVYTCEKSGNLHLAEPGVTPCSPADKIWARFEIFLKACCRSKYSIFHRNALGSLW